jgi:multiple sugar transport system permease protein
MVRTQGLSRGQAVAQALTPWLIHAILIAGAITMVAPFIWMISTSLKVQGAVYSIPPRWWPYEMRFSNYVEAWTMVPFPRFMLNSAIMAVSISLGQIIFCSMGAYAFARLRWPGRDTVFLLYLGTMMIPDEVTLIPSFLIITWLGWMNTYYALVVPSLASAFGTFLLRQFFLAIPQDLEDAAHIDGASRLQILWLVILPLSRQAVAALAIFSSLSAWNAFLWPLIVTNQEEMYTIQIGLSAFKDQFYNVQWPQLMAGTTMVTVPVLLVFFFAQKQIIEGISFSGLKG